MKKGSAEFLRVIGGELRGRKIRRPMACGVRPTKDRIREAVFNMVFFHIPGALVLDLFAGSGAYGIEALSRGAREAVFVDRDPMVAEVISENIVDLGLSDRGRVEISDLEQAQSISSGSSKRFDVVFSDPPYRKGLARKTLNIINQYDILCLSGILVIEHHADEVLPGLDGDINIFKQKTYGDTIVSLFRRQ